MLAYVPLNNQWRCWCILRFTKLCVYYYKRVWLKCHKVLGLQEHFTIFPIFYDVLFVGHSVYMYVCPRSVILWPTSPYACLCWIFHFLMLKLVSGRVKYKDLFRTGGIQMLFMCASCAGIALRPSICLCFCVSAKKLKKLLVRKIPKSWYDTTLNSKSGQILVTFAYNLWPW